MYILSLNFLCYFRDGCTYFVNLVLNFIILNILGGLSFDIQRLKLELKLIFNNLVNIFISKIATSFNYLRLINLLFQYFGSYLVPVRTSIWGILVGWINWGLYIFISVVIDLLIALFFIVLNTVIMIQIYWIFMLIRILLLTLYLLLILL